MKRFLIFWLGTTAALGAVHLILVSSNLEYWLLYHAGVFEDEHGPLEGLSVKTAVLLVIFLVPPLLGLFFVFLGFLFGTGGSWTKPPSHLPLAVEPEPEPERPVNPYEAAILAGVEAAERVQPPPEEAGDDDA